MYALISLDNPVVRSQFMRDSSGTQQMYNFENRVVVRSKFIRESSRTQHIFLRVQLYAAKLLPAEPAFTCGDDNNSTNNNTSGFGLSIFRVGAGSGRIWIVDFLGRRRFGAGFGLWIFRAGGGSGPDLHCGFQWYAANLYRIPVVRSKFI